MDLSEKEIDFYEITPEFNSQGRLCNHGSGYNQKVKVMVDEWDRFNQLAGRQHEIIDGIVIFNPELGPCFSNEVLYSELRDAEKKLLAILDKERIDAEIGISSGAKIMKHGLEEQTEKEVLIERIRMLRELV